jgi:O-antigen/teichoic acid export membrane protein
MNSCCLAQLSESELGLSSDIEAKLSRIFLIKGAIWTVGSYAVNQVVRLGTNVVLARLLAPEIFGVMFIVTSLRTGADLISDLGFGQNIVQNAHADEPDFYNTAWTLQVLRGLLLWVICAAATLPLAHLYDSAILAAVLPVAAVAFIFSGVTSVSRYLLQRRMQFARLNLFETITVLISSLAYIVLAFLSPTIWALVIGSLVGYAAPMVGSYLLIPGFRQRFHISKKYSKQILHFGFWIFVSSVVYFFSMNFDRLYLAKIVPLELLGIYGIARNISELLGLLVLRIASGMIFPIIASLAHMPRQKLRARVSSTRLRLLMVAGLGFSIFASAADLIVSLIYDQRYQAAGWMLPILIIGAWVSILCSINESTLLGLGKPSYGAIANSLKFGYLALALPLLLSAYGSRGAVIVVAVSDIFRYIPIALGQRRERFSFIVQDLIATVFMLAFIALGEWLRWIWGFGTSFDGFASAAFI